MERNEQPEHPPESSIQGFEVFLNGSKLCTAGVGLVGSLNALRVGGSQNKEILMWVKRRLEIGDEITIRIVDNPSIDNPISRFPSDFMANERGM